jgi:hypothetical protein
VGFEVLMAVSMKISRDEVSTECRKLVGIKSKTRMLGEILR